MSVPDLSSPITPRRYTKTLTIPASAIDVNGHVNNVVYVQWMQDIAVEHYLSLGGRQEPETAWVVREHRIQYLLPAFAGEEIAIHTWVENIRRVSLLRKYEFTRREDGKALVKGETEWVQVNVRSGRPQTIREEVPRLLGLA